MDRFQELIPAYALDALDERERRELERHLLGCDSCRSELRAYREAAASLPYATPLVEPPPDLRDRVLRAARAESAVSTPLRPRRIRRRAFLLAPVAAAAAAAVLVAVLSAGHGSSTDWVRTATTRVALAGGKGVVVVSGSRGAILPSLRQAPRGHTYEAWIVRAGSAIAAGTFRTSSSPVVLTVPVRPGDIVAVTVEPGAGSAAPTSKPIASAKV